MLTQYVQRWRLIPERVLTIRTGVFADGYSAAGTGMPVGSVSEVEAFARCVVGVQGLRTRYSGQPPGGRGCRVASGGVADEKPEDYIRNQQPPEQDDSFASV